MTLEQKLKISGAVFLWKKFRSTETWWISLLDLFQIHKTNKYKPVLLRKVQQNSLKIVSISFDSSHEIKTLTLFQISLHPPTSLADSSFNTKEKARCKFCGVSHHSNCWTLVSHWEREGQLVNRQDYRMFKCAKTHKVQILYWWQSRQGVSQSPG